MYRFALLALVVACSHPAPVAPAPAPENQAVVYAHLLAKQAACAPLPQGIEDGALCVFGRVLTYCHAGKGAPSCDAYADLTPQQPKVEEKKPEEKKVEEKAAETKKPDGKAEKK